MAVPAAAFLRAQAYSVRVNSRTEILPTYRAGAPEMAAPVIYADSQLRRMVEPVASFASFRQAISGPSGHEYLETAPASPPNAPISRRCLDARAGLEPAPPG